MAARGDVKMKRARAHFAEAIRLLDGAIKELRAAGRLLRSHPDYRPPGRHDEHLGLPWWLNDTVRSVLHDEGLLVHRAALRDDLHHGQANMRSAAEDTKRVLARRKARAK